MPLLLAGAARGGPWPALLSFYPILAFGMAVAMALRLDRARIAVVVLMVVAADLALAAAATRPALLLAPAVFLAVDFVALAWTRERGIVSGASLLWLAALVIEAALAIWLGMPENARLADRIGAPLVPFELPCRLPQGAALVIAGAGVTLGSRFFARRAAMDAGLLWAMVASTLGLAAPPGGARAWLATALMVMVIASFEESLALAYQDELTGLPGRRALAEALVRLRGDYAIAMVDIDHFKRLNDRYGHAVGDQILRMVASRLTDPSAKVYRYGGEEFAVIVRGVDRARAGRLIDAMRARVAGSAFVTRAPDRPREAPRKRPQPAADRAGIRVTISAGFAVRGEGELPDSVVSRADRALYKAKENGRNRVEG